jgi:hypothetical protein
MLRYNEGHSLNWYEFLGKNEPLSCPVTQVKICPPTKQNTEALMAKDTKAWLADFKLFLFK